MPHDPASGNGDRRRRDKGVFNGDIGMIESVSETYRTLAERLEAKV